VTRLSRESEAASEGRVFYGGARFCFQKAIPIMKVFSFVGYLLDYNPCYETLLVDLGYALD